MEIVKVTSVSGSTFTVTRAQEGTSNVSHASGSAIEMLITAGHFTEIETLATISSVSEPGAQARLLHGSDGNRKDAESPGIVRGVPRDFHLRRSARGLGVGQIRRVDAKAYCRGLWMRHGVGHSTPLLCRIRIQSQPAQWRHWQGGQFGGRQGPDYDLRRSVVLGGHALHVGFFARRILSRRRFDHLLG